MSSGIGEFFAIDRRAWSFVCGRVGLNSAVAYLVLARGTGPDNRTTAWSTNAVETYTGIGRVRAKDAIDRLLASEAVQRTGSDTRPRYLLHPFLSESGPEWIWLPNALVDGAAGEIAPIELLRQTQSLAALRLFVNLYDEHNLASDGGIHWRRIRRTYERRQVGESGQFTVWGFAPSIETTWSDSPIVRDFLTGKYVKTPREGGGVYKRDSGLPVFWDAWGLLKRLGLVQIVGHLVEADNDDAELIHPCAAQEGEQFERDLAFAANMAGAALLTEGQRQWAAEHCIQLVPVASHIAAVQMVGLARLRYRPRTKATAAWAAAKQKWADFQQRYEVIAGSNGTQLQRAKQETVV